MPRPNAELVGLLEAMLETARSGELQELFGVVRYDNGEYDAEYTTGDLGHMLAQVRTEVIRAQIDAAEPAEPEETRH